MIADNYPDYDLAFLDGTTGKDLTAQGRGFDSDADGLQKSVNELNGLAEGHGVERVRGDLVSLGQSLRGVADQAAAAAAAHAAMKAAWDAWKRNAPRQAEIAAAEKKVAAATEKLRTATDHHAGAARAELKQAEDALRDLVARREDADAALAGGLEEAKRKLASSGGGWGAWDKELTSPPSAQHATPPTTPDPAQQRQTPPMPPMPTLDPAGAPPAAVPPAQAAPPTPAGGGAVDPRLAAAVAESARQQPQQAPTTPAMTPAMAAPAAAAGQPQRQQRGEDQQQIDPAGLASALGLPIPIGTNGPAATPAATTPAAPAEAQGAPPAASPNSLAGAAPVNQTNPGASLTGLRTDDNVTGRPDGVPARSANDITTRTAAATATAEQAAPGAGDAATAGVPGAGVPVTGPMGAIGGPAVGGGGKQSQTVLARMTQEQREMLGLNAIARAVPGGTIAQKRDDDEDQRR